MSENCDGCAMNRNHLCQIVRFRPYGAKTCPCSLCIVKTQCWKACEEFREYKRNLTIKIGESK